MRKAAVIAAVLLMSIGGMTGCNKEEVEEKIQPLVAEVQNEAEAEGAKETQSETEETPLLPEIETGLPIEPGARIAVVSKSTKGEFWDLVKKGMEEVVHAVNTAYGYEKDDQITMTFEGPSDEQNVADQINTIDAVLAENPDILCIAAGDADSCQAQLETARENGIPVIVFDSNVSETKYTRAFRGTDNVKLGEMAAYRLGRAIGKMGNVVVFSAQEKTGSAKDRTDGFLSNIANYSDIKVLEVVYQDQVDDMEQAMKDVLEKYPTLDGVFCTNAVVSEMYLDIQKDETAEPIAMVGVDATTKQQEAIRNGEEVGVISQAPYAIGYQTMWAAIQSTAPKKKLTVEKNVLLAPMWIDLERLDDPGYSDYIYAK